MFSLECRIAVANASSVLFMSDFQFDSFKAHVVIFFSPSLNPLKATQRVTMSSDFSDNSGRAGSWKRTALLGGGGGEFGARFSLGKNILSLAFPLGFVAWSDRDGAQPPPTPPRGFWVGTAAPEILAPEPVTSSCAEPAKLCHLSVTVFILIFSLLS